MEPRNLVRQLFDDCGADFAAGERIVEQRRLFELFHFDRVFERRALAAHQRSLTGSR